MKEKINWFWVWEKRIWKEKINANPYFATLSISYAALVGACVGGGEIFHEWFGWNTDTSYPALGLLLILVWGCNVAESIIASKGTLMAVWRSLLILLCLALAFAVGFIASVVVIILVVAWLALMLVGSLLSGSGGGGSKKKRYTLDDGTEVEKESGLFGSTGSYREVGGSRTFHDEGGGYVRED